MLEVLFYIFKDVNRRYVFDNRSWEHLDLDLENAKVDTLL